MKGNEDSDATIERVFAHSDAVRYVAIYREGQLAFEQRPDLVGASDAQSDRYEELLVNPTLLELLTQRGEIDCGGLQFVLIRYGSFFQFVSRIPGGHVSVALEPGAEALALAHELRQLLT